MPSYVLAMLPYLVTLALILLSRRAGRRRPPRPGQLAAPASLAVPYFREER